MPSSYRMLATEIALDAVAAERERQESLVAAGKFASTCAGEMSDVDRYLVLAEEVAEVTQLITAAAFDGALRDDFRERLREELVQVAAVAVAWIEGLASDADMEPDADA